MKKYFPSRPKKDRKYDYPPLEGVAELYDKRYMGSDDGVTCLIKMKEPTQEQLIAEGWGDWYPAEPERDAIYLFCEGERQMSDNVTQRWHGSYTWYRHYMKGDILIFGGGVGLLQWNLAKKRNVKSICVVENNEFVYKNLIMNLETKDKTNKIYNVCGDAFDAPLHIGKQFDWILFDIWKVNDTKEDARKVAMEAYRLGGLWEDNLKKGGKMDYLLRSFVNFKLTPEEEATACGKIIGRRA